MQSNRPNLNTIFIIPTGIGCEIGGHAGDGNTAVKLIASVSDTMIVHPNCVNASDINEMPDNCLYVEGSILDNFLKRGFGLQPVHQNRILLAVNESPKPETINAVNAARVTLGADIKIIVLNTPFKMKATKDPLTGAATGEVSGVEELALQLRDIHNDYDALALYTPIDVEKYVGLDYVKNGGVNPWGGVEAMASRTVAEKIGKPVAHGPCGHTLDDFNEVTDPRIAPEMVSVCYLHCLLKGLHKAPRAGYYLDSAFKPKDFSVLISPYPCWGAPHEAAKNLGMKIIFVEENKTCFPPTIIPSISYHNVEWVKNYWEAAGVISCMRAGILPESVRRPINGVKII